MRKGGKLVGEIKGEDRQWWSDGRGEMKEESWVGKIKEKRGNYELDRRGENRKKVGEGTQRGKPVQMQRVSHFLPGC